METLSDDLKALVNAKELTLRQALELNKQKKPKEEQMINLWDNDGDEEDYDKTAVADMLKIRHGDLYWGESKTVITAPGVSRRPGNQVGLFASEGKDGNAWLLTFAYNYNGFLKNKNMKHEQELPTHVLQSGNIGMSITKLINMYGSDIRGFEDVVGMKFFYCTLMGSKKVYHFSTKDKRIMEQIDGLLSDGTFYGLKNAFAELARKKAYTPLKGHTATHGDMRNFHTKSDGKTCTSFHVWVQFEDDVVSTRYFNKASGPFVKSATPLYEARAPMGSLQVLHQPSIDERTLGKMTMPVDYGIEMQKLMISELPEVSDKGIKQACFLCKGTGKRQVSSNLYMYIYLNISQ